MDDLAKNKNMKNEETEQEEKINNKQYKICYRIFSVQRNQIIVKNFGRPD